ncbi:hypothetical protein KC669_04955 [Candidatus Dojkabacteria bacterium]|uniref:Bacterial spore germination immunoglobulin-like domain-containing protein n=1 Tax=Candidatus Dojkabacteria bacterium TaxID=2099670 RepID=A0A955RLR7_9BACT|nr:hypothetical protein [Candidatus Dojkabacteria bacterium]
MKQRSNLPNMIFIPVILVTLVALLFLFTKYQSSISNDTDNSQEVINNNDNQSSESNEKTWKYISDKGAELVLIEPSDISRTKCPINIKGQMENKGWFFEATFPLKLVDSNGEIVEQTFATATSEWTTEGFVDFDATINCAVNNLSGYKLILMADNAADLPELDDSITIEL